MQSKHTVRPNCVRLAYFALGVMGDSICSSGAARKEGAGTLFAKAVILADVCVNNKGADG